MCELWRVLVANGMGYALSIAAPSSEYIIHGQGKGVKYIPSPLA